MTHSDQRNMGAASLPPPNPALETKNADWHPASTEVREAFGEFLAAFEAFKDANDERLGQIEKRLSADVVTTDKVERINQAVDEQKRIVDEIALSMRRPALGAKSRGPFDPRAGEHKRAWDAYMRKGEVGRLSQVEAKALSMGSDPDGGYLVPEEVERTIDRVLSEVSPIRAISGVRQISSASLKKPFTTSGPATGWVGETEARPQTDTPVLAEMEFPAMELYAMPAATASLLEDAAIDVEAWIAEEVQTVFAEQEGAAFVNGDGVKKPLGFLSYTTVDNASWSWGNIGTVLSGADAAFPAADPGDKLIDLVYALKSGYRANAHWVMNRTVQADIRKFKDADGNYLWQPGLAAGQPATLLNYPIAESEDMPDIALGAHALAFGDFKRGYLIVDRMGVRVLRDPYSAKPYVLFYTTKRVGGGVQNFEAIKLMKFSAT